VSRGLDYCELRFHGLSRLPLALAGLVTTGWRVEAAPAARSLPRNGQTLSLLAGTEDKRVRLFAYTVTESSRNRPHERRVEITSTYPGGLPIARHYTDVVVAFDRESNGWVGLDNRRLSHGGPTHNASSFVPSSGFKKIVRGDITILPMETNLFETEFAAFFHAEQLAEYIFNAEQIHAGTYNGAGIFSGAISKPAPVGLSVRSDTLCGDDIVFRAPVPRRKKIAVNTSLISAYQDGLIADVKGREITREQLLELKRRCDEIGLNGERWVLSYERRRLKRAGRHDLADKIEWVSQTSPFAGFDISSFDASGDRRHIEVKATISGRRKFEMTENEWASAQSLRASYNIYRVTSLETYPALKIFVDPVALLESGVLTRRAANWLVEY